jgi:hypothetical protein
VVAVKQAHSELVRCPAFVVKLLPDVHEMRARVGAATGRSVVGVQGKVARVYFLSSRFTGWGLPAGKVDNLTR